MLPYEITYKSASHPLWNTCIVVIDQIIWAHWCKCRTHSCVVIFWTRWIQAHYSTRSQTAVSSSCVSTGKDKKRCNRLKLQQKWGKIKMKASDESTAVHINHVTYTCETNLWPQLDPKCLNSRIKSLEVHRSFISDRYCRIGGLKIPNLGHLFCSSIK